MKYILSVVLVLSLSAHADQYLHPVTGDVVSDFDVIELSSQCPVDSFMGVGVEREVHRVYPTGFYAADGVSNVCQIKFGVDAPDGWRVQILVDTSISGEYSGSAMLSAFDTLGGNTVPGHFEYYQAGGGEINMQINDEEIAFSECGANFQIKSMDNVISVSGNISISGIVRTYRFIWIEC